MKKQLIFLSLLVCASITAMAGPKDSIGTKVKNGKIFIMHKVEKSQGLYAISRKYKVPLADIIAHNPGSDEMLNVDQIILIPTGKNAPFEEKVVKEYFSNETQTQEGRKASQKSTFAKYHKVLKGETLYSISVLYKTEVDVLKNLNNLSTTEIREGMELIVPSSVEEKEERTDKVASAQKKADSLEKEIKNVRKNIKTEANTPTTEVKPNNLAAYERKVERIAEYDVEKVWEKGIAETMTTNGAVNAKVCSHHEAEIGTTIMVTNPTNSKAIFVKVIENHRLNSSSGNNILLLSKSAMDYIGLESNNTIEVSFAR